MTAAEVESILKLLEERIVRGCEARDAHGVSCHYDDPAAVTFSLDGALFRVVGSARGYENARELVRVLTPDKVPGGDNWLRLLMDFNDRTSRSKDAILRDIRQRLCRTIHDPR